MENNNNQSNTIAIVGFILAFFVEIAGLICSIIGLKKSKELNGNGKGLSIAGIIISSIRIVLGIGVLILIALITFYSEEETIISNIKDNINENIGEIEEDIDDRIYDDVDYINIMANNKNNSVSFIYNEDTEDVTKVQVKINGNIVKDYEVIYSYNDGENNKEQTLNEDNIQVLKGKDKDYFVLLIPEASEYIDGRTNPTIVNELGEKIYEIEYPFNTGIYITDTNSKLFGKDMYYIDNDKLYFATKDCNDLLFKENTLTVSNDKINIENTKVIEASEVGGSFCPEN